MVTNKRIIMGWEKCLRPLTPATWEDCGLKPTQGKKIWRIHFNNKLGVVTQVPVIPATHEARGRRMVFEVVPEQKCETLLDK
jgi:hypothetical protein